MQCFKCNGVDRVFYFVGDVCLCVPCLNVYTSEELKKLYSEVIKK